MSKATQLGSGARQPVEKAENWIVSGEDQADPVPPIVTGSILMSPPARISAQRIIDRWRLQRGASVVATPSELATVRKHEDAHLWMRAPAVGGEAWSFEDRPVVFLQRTSAKPPTPKGGSTG